MSRIKTTHFNRISMTAVVLVILAGLFGAAFQPVAAADTTNIAIVSVSKGESVTISVSGMPANKEFQVLMNKIGTQGVDGTVAGTGKTSSDGSFTKTFLIPAGLKRESRVAIRIEATDKTGWFAYNWFTNSTSGSSSTGSGSSVSSVGSVSSTGNLSIVDVEEDTAVDVRVKNLPANRTFQVWFDWKTRNSAVKGMRSGTVKSDSDGNIVASLKMPAVLVDRHEVRVRLQAIDGSNVSASGWFLNADSDEDTGGGAPAGSNQRIPYLLIGSVVEDESVTVEAYNFPKNTRFDVYMDRIGTQAEDGILVETVKSPKTGSSFSFTVDIPRDLRNRAKIAIRLEGEDDSDLFAYSWFENSTTSASQ